MLNNQMANGISEDYEPPTTARIGRSLAIYSWGTPTLTSGWPPTDPPVLGVYSMQIYEKPLQKGNPHTN